MIENERKRRESLDVGPKSMGGRERGRRSRRRDFDGRTRERDRPSTLMAKSSWDVGGSERAASPFCLVRTSGCLGEMSRSRR